MRPVRQKRYEIQYSRRMHYLFMATYTLMSLLFIIGCAIWINYRAIFQSGIMAFMHIITGILIGIYIPANTIEALSVPAIRHEREEQRRRQEDTVFRRGAPIMIVACVTGIILSSIYFYNLGYIVIGKCPVLADQDAMVNPTVITLELAYRHRPMNELYTKRSVLSLNYNTTSKTIVRKTRDTNPSAVNYAHWMTQNEYHSMTKEASLQDTPFCMNRSDSMLFSFLENEIVHLLATTLHDRQEHHSIRVNDKYHRTTLSNELEDEADLDHMICRICRHEYAFVIVLMCFILLWDIFSIALISYCIYLIRSDPVQLQ